MALEESLERTLTILIALVGCTTPRADSQSETQPPQQAVARQTHNLPMIRDNDSICEPPGGRIPDAAVLGHWFANDARGHRRTFGFTPPESATVVLVPDSATMRRADRALDAQFAKWESTGISAKTKSRKVPSVEREVDVLVYKARNIYAVVDRGQEFCGGDGAVMPIIFFFDKKWRYLGSRSN